MAYSDIQRILKSNTGTEEEFTELLNKLKPEEFYAPIPGDPYRRTILHYAIYWEEKERPSDRPVSSVFVRAIIKVAKRKQVLPELLRATAFDREFTPLLLAAEEAHLLNTMDSETGLPLYKFLKNEGSSCNETDAHGNTILHIICINAFFVILDQLIENDKDLIKSLIQIKNDEGLNPFGSGLVGFSSDMSKLLRPFVDDLEAPEQTRLAKESLIAKKERIRAVKRAAFSSSYLSCQSITGFILALAAATLSVLGDLEEKESALSITTDTLSIFLLFINFLLELEQVGRKQIELANIRAKKLERYTYWDRSKKSCCSLVASNWIHLKSSSPSIWPTLFFGLFGVLISGIGLILKYTNTSTLAKSIIMALAPFFTETLASRNGDRLEAEINLYQDIPMAQLQYRHFFPAAGVGAGIAAGAGAGAGSSAIAPAVPFSSSSLKKNP